MHLKSRAAFLAIFAVFVSPSATADEVNLKDSVKKEEKILTPATPPLDCAKVDEFRKKLPPDQTNAVWQDADKKTTIAFDPGSWTITVCQAGKAVTGKFLGKPSPETVVDVSRPYLKDLNGDGKMEFIAFHGQCAEGPCLGSRALLQIDGDRIKQLYALQSELLDMVNESPVEAFKLTRICFTHEFGIGFEYFVFARFEKDGSLDVIPPPRIQALLPKTYADFLENLRKTPPITGNEKLKKTEETLNAIRLLIADAYAGTSEKVLKTSFASATSHLREPDLATQLGIYCDPWAVIKAIADGR